MERENESGYGERGKCRERLKFPLICGLFWWKRRRWRESVRILVFLSGREREGDKK